MKVGINALYWIPNAMGGTQTYFLNLLKALLLVDTETEYVVFLNSAGEMNFPFKSPRIRVIVCPFSGSLRSLRLLWENIALDGFAQRYELDVVHSLGYLTPVKLRAKSVVTVLDMVHYMYPQGIKTSKLFLWKLLLPLTLKKADRIISISNSVKKDISHYFPWASSKITPIHLGIDRTLFRPLASSQAAPDCNELSTPFILAVASISPHKNIEILIRALALAKLRFPNLKLIMVGKNSPHSDKLIMIAKSLSVDTDITFTGRITDQELVVLYQKAVFMVFPSLYEGFGLPLLESMACGCPVIASNSSSIPEVVGRAALQFDPKNVGQLAELMERVLSSESIREDLVQKGLSNADRFSWEETAALTFNLYRQCVA